VEDDWQLSVKTIISKALMAENKALIFIKFCNEDKNNQ
jgi:hypothetical protein